MNVKNLLTIGLLLFVAASVAVLIARESGRAPEAAEPGNEAALPDAAVVAYYFHNNTRCPTCRSIESYSQEAIEQRFAEQLGNGQLEWRIVNYEAPEHAHFATEYELFAPSVILVRTANHQVADWRNLDRVWELVGQEDSFVAYVQEQTEEMLATASSL